MRGEPLLNVVGLNGCGEHTNESLKIIPQCLIQKESWTTQNYIGRHIQPIRVELLLNAGGLNGCGVHSDSQDDPTMPKKGRPKEKGRYLDMDDDYIAVDMKFNLELNQCHRKA